MLTGIIAGQLSAGGTVFLNSADKHADLTLSNGDLTATKTTAPQAWRNARSTASHASGRKYFEAKYFAAANCIAGLMNAVGGLDAYPGINAESCGLDKSGDYHSNGGATAAVLADVTNNDWIGIDADLDANTIKFRNVTAAGAWSAAQTLPVNLQGANACFVVVGMPDQNDTMTVNFGASAFAGTIPVGCTSWDGSQTG